MNILIVYSHPEPSSLNASLTRRALSFFEKSGHNVEISDLYGEGFNPVDFPSNFSSRIDEDRFDLSNEQRHAWKEKTTVPEIQREIDRLKKADLIIFQFPIWWHQQPAMIKGWFDRVFISGGLYNSHMRYEDGYFKGKEAIISVTSGAAESTYTKNGRGGGEINTLLRPMHFSLHYMGFSVIEPFITADIPTRPSHESEQGDFLDQIANLLQNWENCLVNLATRLRLSFPNKSDWETL